MSSSNRRQLTNKSSVLCPTSSKLTSQYMILDHLNNHYKKIASAKSAIDTSPPKSLLKSQKVRDRSQFHTSTTTPFAFTNKNLDFYYIEGETYDDDDEEKKVRSIMHEVLSSTHHENNNQRPMTARYENDLHLGKTIRFNSRPMSARSVRSTQSQPAVHSHPRNVNSDIINKHTKNFTEPTKPFTPRTLKTNRCSKLREYKYYNPPAKHSKTGPLKKDIFSSNEAKPEKSSEIVPPLDLNSNASDLLWLQEQAQNIECDKATSHSKPLINNDDIFSREDNLSHTYTNFIKRSHGNSVLNEKLTSREEELKYVEFIKEVTNDILSRGVYTDRAMVRVLETHARRHMHDLDENKIRSLLRKLRIDLGIPSERMTNITNDGKYGRDVLDSTEIVRNEVEMLGSVTPADDSINAADPESCAAKMKVQSGDECRDNAHKSPGNMNGRKTQDCEAEFISDVRDDTVEIWSHVPETSNDNTCSVAHDDPILLVNKEKLVEVVHEHNIRGENEESKLVNEIEETSELVTISNIANDLDNDKSIIENMLECNSEMNIHEKFLPKPVRKPRMARQRNVNNEGSGVPLATEAEQTDAFNDAPGLIDTPELKYTPEVKDTYDLKGTPEVKDTNHLKDTPELKETHELIDDGFLSNETSALTANIENKRLNMQISKPSLNEFDSRPFERKFHADFNNIYKDNTLSNKSNVDLVNDTDDDF